MASVVVKIELDGVAVRRLFRGRGSPTTNDLERRGRLVLARARQLAPGTMKRKITSVTVTVGRDSDTVEVACSHPAIMFVTDGTKPHLIYPHPRPKGRLRFKVRGGRYVYARVVHHPGNRPNDFMMRALRAGGNLAGGS